MNTANSGSGPADMAAQQLNESHRLAGILMDVGLRAQRLVLARMQEDEAEAPPVFPDPAVIGNVFNTWYQNLLQDPQTLIKAQQNLWDSYMRLAENTLERMKEPQTPPLAAPKPGDRRFSDDQWTTNPTLDYLKQAYLLTVDWAADLAETAQGLDPHQAHMVRFYMKQITDAISPTNSAWTNPEVIRATLESGGENLIRGFEHMLDDLELGNGRLRIRMTDIDAFEVGRNLAVTPGKVVFQNKLFQLIQYTPTTPKVHRRPLLIIPPWINKFYILDLGPKKSFIKWAVDQGHTVFIVSWVNPDGKLRDESFGDYMTEGFLTAVDAVEAATGENSINVIGYCIGGTLTASALAYMADKGDKRVNSATYFTSLVDFADAGDVKVFLDEEQLGGLESHMDRDGYLDGSVMSTAFNMLRSNDLIWSFVVRNYLMGKEPIPFDLLYWNSDSTRMPAMMHSFYLRKMYMENKLVEPGAIELGGVPIDLRTIETPTYILSAKEDHIAPWKGTYSATQIYKGPVTFVLGGSGHIAGVINPATSSKYGYRTNNKNPAAPQDWLAGAAEHEGSWWPHWNKWIARKGGGKVGARTPGDGKLKALEDAPGSYVRATTPRDWNAGTE